MNSKIRTMASFLAISIFLYSVFIMPSNAANTENTTGASPHQEATTTTSSSKNLSSPKADTKKAESSSKNNLSNTPAPKLGDDPTPTPAFDATPENNDLWRAHIEQKDVLHVDPYTGNLSAYIPIFNIPENDGINLQVGLSMLASNDPSRVGQSFIFYPQAAYSNAMHTIEFVDPAGQKHLLYGRTDGNFTSKDHWHASNLSLNQYITGYIYSPDGTQYYIWNNELRAITSKNGATKITYSYDGDYGPLATISDNTGITINFNWANYYNNQTNPSLSITEGSNTYQVNCLSPLVAPYSIQADSCNVSSIQNIQQPIGSSWAFQWTADSYPGMKNKTYYLSQITYPSQRVTTIQSTPNYSAVSLLPSGAAGPWYGYYRVNTLQDSWVGMSPGIAPETTSYQYTEISYGTQSTQRTSIINPVGDTEVLTFTNHPLFLPLYQPSAISYPIGTFTQNSGLLLTDSIYTGTYVPGESHPVQMTSYHWSSQTLFGGGSFINCYVHNNTTGNNNPSFCGPLPSDLQDYYLTNVTINRDGENYFTDYSNYDAYGYPQTIVEHSSQGSITRNLTYLEDPTHWVFAPANETDADTSSGAIFKTIARIFDSKNNLTSYTENGVVTTYGYDPLGNLISSTNALGKTTTFSDYHHGKPQTLTDPMGHTAHFLINPEGTIASYTDPMGNTSAFTYDSLFRLTGINKPSPFAPTTITWSSASWEDITGPIEFYILQRGNFKKAVEYDYFGLPEKTILTDQTTGEIRMQMKRYDPLHRLNFQSLFYNTVNKKLPLNGQVFSYDALGRITAQDYNFGNSAYLTSYAYGPDNALTITDPLGNKTTAKYRSFGNPDEKQLMLVQSPNGVNTTIQRNPDGQVSNIQQGNYTRTYQYNANHYLISESNPETGIINYGRDLLGNMTSKQVGNSAATQYFYDASHHLIETLYPVTELQNGMTVRNPGAAGTWLVLNGQLSGFSNSANSYEKIYTSHNQDVIVDPSITEKKPTGPTIDTASLISINGGQVYFVYNSIACPIHNPDIFNTYHFDWTKVQPIPLSQFNQYTPGPALDNTATDSNANFYTYDADGRLVTSNNAVTNWSYFYDADSNLIEAKQDTGSQSADIHYEYNSLDQLAAMVYPDNTRITYSPNAFGQPTEIAPYVSLINYYPNGAIASWSDELGQAHDHYLQNDRQMTNSLELFYFNQLIVQLNYIYDGDDNITSIQDLKTPNNTMQLTYNSMNWLTGGTGPWGAASISYDANGNITSKNIGSTQLSYSYDGARDILNSVSGTSNETFSYDAYGDVTSVNNNELDYDGQQHLIHEKGTNAQNQPYETSYMYDANGHRSVIIPSTGDRSFEVYNQQSQRLWQYDQNTQMATDYIYLAGHEILEMKHLANQAPAAPDMTYMHDDLLGSPILTTDATGYIIWQQQYAPYGTELNGINRPNHSTSYTGKPKNQDTGLSYYGARYYSPDLGRFMSIDPESVNPENIMSFNRYAYANNNPYLYKDPTGNFPDPIEAVAGAILGGIAGYSQTGTFSGTIIGGAIGSVTAVATSVAGSYAASTAMTTSTMAKIGLGFASRVSLGTVTFSEMNDINTGHLNVGSAALSAATDSAVGYKVSPMKDINEASSVMHSVITMTLASGESASFGEVEDKVSAKEDAEGSSSSNANTSSKDSDSGDSSSHGSNNGSGNNRGNSDSSAGNNSGDSGSTGNGGSSSDKDN